MIYLRFESLGTLLTLPKDAMLSPDFHSWPWTALISLSLTASIDRGPVVVWCTFGFAMLLHQH